MSEQALLTIETQAVRTTFLVKGVTCGRGNHCGHVPSPVDWYSSILEYIPEMLAAALQLGREAGFATRQLSV